MGERTATRIHRDWFFIALLVGLVLLGAAAFASRQLTEKYNSIQSVEGIAVGTAPDGLVSGTEFTATDGKTYEVGSEWFGQYRVGSKTTVYYPEASPEEGQTEPFERNYNLPKFLLIVSVLCVGLGLRGLARPGYNYGVSLVERRRQKVKALRTTKESNPDLSKAADEIRDSDILKPRSPF